MIDTLAFCIVHLQDASVSVYAHDYCNSGNRMSGYGRISPVKGIPYADICVRSSVCVGLLGTAVAQHGAPYDWRADTSLLYHIAPVVQHRDGAEIHQYWQFPDDTGLWDTITPFFSSLEQYRAEIRERVPDTSPLGLIRLNRIMFAQSAALADTSEIANTLIVEGKVGHHRPMNCLETHLFAYQAARYPMLTHPTEFHAFILRRSGSGHDSVRVYFVASDQPFPPKPAYAISAIENDLTSGWRLYGHLHNHTFNFDTANGWLAVPAPGKSDVQYYRGLHEELQLEHAFVAEGFNTIELNSEEFKLLPSAE